MTLHTRVMVTSAGVDPAAAFVRMRQIIGAGEQYDAFTTPDPASSNEYLHTTGPGHHMSMGQGLPALMWVEFANPGETLGGDGHDDYCEEGCDGYCHDPAGYIEINYDTGYAYRVGDAHAGDLHAWITQQIGAWLDAQGATWMWFDESGDGWQPPTVKWGTLGDPERGALDRVPAS